MAGPPRDLTSVERGSARLIVRDTTDRILLFRTRDPSLLGGLGGSTGRAGLPQDVADRAQVRGAGEDEQQV